MTEQKPPTKPNDGQSRKTRDGLGGRKPYSRPRVISVDKLEVVAALCDKADPSCELTGVVSS